MNPEYGKRLIRIEREEDIEVLRQLATDALKMAWELSKAASDRHPRNYTVDVWQTRGDEGWFLGIEDGSKEYCLGYCESQDFAHLYRVRCGQFVVWPDEAWSSSADEHVPSTVRKRRDDAGGGN